MYAITRGVRGRNPGMPADPEVTLMSFDFHGNRPSSFVLTENEMASIVFNRA